MRAPSFEPRRRRELQDELLNRARAWLRDWHPRDEGDFATALFKIAARIESEVTQRLDRAPEKTFRAFLDWLGVKGKPGLAARLPVVFTMTPGSEPVDAPPRVQLQINSGDTPVNFETETALRILPGSLTTLVAADPAADKFFLSPSGLFRLEAPALVPTVWTLKSDAAAASNSLQLDPAAGLDPGITIADPAGRPYRLLEVNGAIVTIDPPLDAALAATTILRRVDAFNPFGPLERNRQEHALYIGSSSALNVEAPATIGVKNGASIPPDATWWYSGKPTPSAPDGWVPLRDVAIDGADLLLKKPKGAIETLKIDGYSSRWLKATRPPGAQTGSESSGLRLFVNCLPDIQQVPPVTALEGIANTTPLVLDAGFYPFGREPRQFDSFYVGSKEAFSKASAEALLHFSLGARVKNARAAIGFTDLMYATVGISEDGRLQRTLHLVAAGKPSVFFGSPTQPSGADHRPIALSDKARPGAALFLGRPHASASAGSDVWVWRQGATGDEWIPLGAPFVAADGTTPDVQGTMLARRGLQLMVYAISGGRLHVRPLDSGAWSETFKLADPEQILTVAPVLKASARAGEQDAADGIVVVSNLSQMWLNDGTTWTRVNGGPDEVDPAFYPLVVLTPAGRLCLVRDEQDLRPRAFNLGTNAMGYTESIDLVGHTADFKPIPGGVVFVFTAIDGNKPAAAYVWDAFAGKNPTASPSTGLQLVEGPLYVGKSNGTSFFYFAGDEGQAFILPVGQIQSVTGASVTDAVTFTDTVNDWTLKDKGFPVDLDPTGTAGRKVAFVNKVYRGSAAGAWVLQVSKPTGSVVTGAPVTLHPGTHDDLRNGVRTAPRTLTLAGDDAEAVVGALMYVTDGTDQFVLKIDGMTPGTPRVITFPAMGPTLPGSPGDTIQYKCLDPAGVAQTGSVHPLVGTSGLDPGVESALSTAELEFTTVAPVSQTVSDVLLAPHLAVLASPWTTKPTTATINFVVKIKLFDAFVVFEPPKPRNPTLSWEYFDGTAWRLIPGLRDSTENLAKGGDVTFCVPRDLQPTDVAGRTNHWIRARLVGGDYGEATVTVTTTPGPVTNSTVQTVDRNTDSIRAPYIAALTVKYRVCCPVTPEFVLARDNGGIIDQTNVTRNASAVVDYFVPLSAALASAAGNDPTAAASDRALYLGFDTSLSGGPIQILFLVEESNTDAAFPLRVDALANNRFKPVVAVTDNTRGLNESGTLEINLAESPQPTGLFGATGYWLRVRPGPALADQAQWQPKIKAAYLNATWATAADTQAFEPLGSSDGSPNQQFVLARPPVIEGTLKLRVLERLGDEDIEQLKRDGMDIRKSFPPTIPEQTGCWVLWRQVVDPADEAAGARVYALDDATGVITFGNGMHGMIPPIGTNVILAEEYRRGGGEAANAIVAWSTINLVTPLAGVNAVVAPDGAAGGSDPQDADATLRFAPANLRLRERALTLPDFEVLALQFSRHVAQVKAIPTSTGMRLVVAMRGRTSKPGRAVVRELRSYLLSQAAPSMAVDRALEITGPEEIPIRIDLGLTLDSIDASGAVAKEARSRLEKWLDPGIGGRDGTGWMLGQVPTDSEIAAALTGIDHVEAIETIVITRVDGQPLTSLTPSQLARLAPDGVTATMLLEQEAGA